MIVDFLHNDVAAPCSAGFVQKYWLPASRFHLFSTIQFGFVDAGSEAICNEGSTIPPYVQHLELVDGEFTSGSTDEVIFGLSLLSNLRNLTLDPRMTSWLTLEAKLECLTAMTCNLTTLSFRCFTVRDFFYHTFV